MRAPSGEVGKGIPAKVLNRERFQLLRPGPKTMLRPAEPNESGPGATKAAVLNHWSTVFGPLLGSPTKSGRVVAPPTPALSPAECVTVSGRPLWNVVIPENSQPPSAPRTSRLG